MNKKLWPVLLALPIAAASIACASTPSKTTTGGGTTVETTVSASASTAPSPAGPFIAFKDGQYEVGTGPGQVKPGKYTAKVPANSINCYWERQKDLEGTFESIIANANSAPGTPVIVTIKATDKGFKTNGCGEWKLAA